MARTHEQRKREPDSFFDRRNFYYLSIKLNIEKNATKNVLRY